MDALFNTCNSTRRIRPPHRLQWQWCLWRPPPHLDEPVTQSANYTGDRYKESEIDSGDRSLGHEDSCDREVQRNGIV